jgi:hypothetical protein
MRFLRVSHVDHELGMVRYTPDGAHDWVQAIADSCKVAVAVQEIRVLIPFEGDHSMQPGDFLHECSMLDSPVWDDMGGIG